MLWDNRDAEMVLSVGDLPPKSRLVALPYKWILVDLHLSGFGVNQDFGSDTTQFDLRDEEALFLAVIVQFNFAPIRECEFQVPLFVARPVDVNRDF